jgi:hypothetical protein
MPLDTKWGVSADVRADISRTFDNAADIYRHLQTHAKYWNDNIMQEQGVKKSTAHRIVRNYLRLLASVQKNTFNGNGVDLQTARTMYKKYEAQVTSDDTEQLLIKLRR